MSDLQEMWDKIPEKPLEEEDVEAIVNLKSKSEVDSFRKVLRLEMLIAWVLIVPFLFLHDYLKMELIILMGLNVFIGTILNVLTLGRLKKLELFENIKSFLVSSIKVFRAFVIMYLTVLLFVDLFMVVIMKFLLWDDKGWVEWLFSKDSTLLFILLVVINVIIIAYVWLIYVKRIQSLKTLLKEIEK